jgi:hypothetical protein
MMPRHRFLRLAWGTTAYNARAHAFSVLLSSNQAFGVTNGESLFGESLARPTTRACCFFLVFFAVSPYAFLSSERTFKWAA